MIFTDCIADLSTIERCGPVGENLLFPRKKSFLDGLYETAIPLTTVTFLWFPKYFHFSTTFWVRHTCTV